jgi:lipoprotein NlpD
MAVMRSGLFRLTAWAVVCGAGLAGCSSALTPAPVVERSTGGDVSAAVQSTTGTSAAPAPTPPVAAAPAVAPAGPGFYRVKPGDTLFGIARTFKQKPADLVKWNNLPESRQVNIDQLLRVAPPGATAAATASDDWSKPGAAPATAKSAQPPLLAGAAPATSATSATPPATPAVKPAPEPSPAEPEAAGKGISLAWPIQGDVITKFGASGSKGIDIAGKVGSPVKAAAPGKVVYAGSGLRAYGQMIIVKHSGDYLTAYAHNSKLLVHEGDTVKQGTTIADVGTGPDGKPVLHFELRKSGQAVDPVPLLK